MQISFLTTYFLPFSIFLIMFGMGLSLRPINFQQIIKSPKALITGLVSQLALPPIVGFLLATITPLPPIWAAGLVVLSACPGGSTSSVITLLAKGNVALSLALAALSSVITVFTLPLIANLAVQTFLDESAIVQLPFLSSLMQIVLMTILPVSLGMLTRRQIPRFARKVYKPVRTCAIAFLSIIILGIILQAPTDDFVATLANIGWVVLLMNAATMILGFAIAMLLNLEKSSIIAITIEVGIQNGGLAIAVASSATMLNSPEMALPAAIYSILMFVTAIGFTIWSRRFFMHGKNPLAVKRLDTRQQHVTLK
jgi:bile acid:Na+ symporter, BASS family